VHSARRFLLYALLEKKNDTGQQVRPGIVYTPSLRLIENSGSIYGSAGSCLARTVGLVESAGGSLITLSLQIYDDFFWAFRAFAPFRMASA
jgi:hypothetical protein